LAATISFGASTILGSRIVKVDPRPGSGGRRVAARSKPDQLCGIFAIALDIVLTPPHVDP
jgi:hypothetical protein